MAATGFLEKECVGDTLTETTLVDSVTQIWFSGCSQVVGAYHCTRFESISRLLIGEYLRLLGFEVVMW